MSNSHPTIRLEFPHHDWQVFKLLSVILRIILISKHTTEYFHHDLRATAECVAPNKPFRAITHFSRKTISCLSKKCPGRCDSPHLGLRMEIRPQ
jgi:hypothetical protein